MFIRWSSTTEFLVIIKKTKMAAMAVFDIGLYSNMNKSVFLRNNKHDWTQTVHDWALDDTYKVYNFL